MYRDVLEALRLEFEINQMRASPGVDALEHGWTTPAAAQEMTANAIRANRTDSKRVLKVPARQMRRKKL